MYKFSAIVAVVLIIVGISFGTYRYFNGKDYKLYLEAVALNEEGKIRQAHDKLIEALKIKKINRKALALKAKLFSIIHNEDLLADAKKNYEVALNAIDRADYTLAIDKLDKTLELLSQISYSSSVYQAALEFQNSVIFTVNAVVVEAPRMYYNKAKVEIARGELERAFNTLTYIVKPSREAQTLKDDIAYTLGSNEYADILNKKNDEIFFIRDSVFWFEKVSKDSPNYKEAQNNITRLKIMIKGKE